MTTMTYDMADFLKLCIARYFEVSGTTTTLRNWSMYVLPEDHRDSPSGAHGTGSVRGRPWCIFTGTFGLIIHYPLIYKLLVWRKVSAETSVDTSSSGQPTEVGKHESSDTGILAVVACSLLMNVAWFARLACPDRLRASITSQPHISSGHPAANL